MTTSREIHLVRRPDGMPVPADFAVVERGVADPAEGEILVQNLLMSVDPYMRPRFNAVATVDEAAVRAVTRELLVRNGYTVLEAADGPAALALVNGAKGPSHIDLLLTDVIMPGMSGRELAEQMIARSRSLRVLYISGYTDDAVVRHGMLEPGLAYLEKPFRPVALLRNGQGGAKFHPKELCAFRSSPRKRDPVLSLPLALDSRLRGNERTVV